MKHIQLEDHLRLVLVQSPCSFLISCFFSASDNRFNSLNTSKAIASTSSPETNIQIQHNNSNNNHIMSILVHLVKPAIIRLNLKINIFLQRFN